MRFINPLGFAAFLSVPAIILMYILKQKFKKHEVSSMLLWERVMLQSEGHKWRQKLKKNTLMILQIISAALASTALAGPFVSAKGERLDYIFVIDSSFSMAASDEKPTRLEKAKEDVLRHIEQSPEGCLFSVVNLNMNPEVLIERTSDRRTAMNAVSSVMQTYSGRDDEALVSVLKMLQSEKEGGVYVFTDSGLEVADSAFSVSIYGKSSENYAVKFVSENGGNLLVKAESYGQAGGTVPVAVFGDGVIIDTKDVEFQGGGKGADVVFSLENLEYKAITAKILVDDMLEEDNSFTYIPESSGLKKALLVTEGNIFLEKAVSLIDGIELYKKSGNAEELSGYDVYIFDGFVPEKLPADGHIMLVNPPGGEKGDFQNAAIENEIFEENARGLTFSVKEASKLAVPLWAEPVLTCGGDVLAYAGEENGIKTFVFGFDIHSSDIPLKKEFPILIYNIMRYFSVEGVKGGGLFAGENAGLNMAPDCTEASVVSPSGRKHDIGLEDRVFRQTDEIGVYTLSEKSHGETEVSYFAVNPVTEGESEMTLGENVLAENSAKTTVRTGKSLKSIFIIAALIILSLEWRVNWRGN